MKQIKVPVEIQDAFRECVACKELATQHGGGIFPSMKAIYYQHRAVRVSELAWRALLKLHPELQGGIYDPNTGLACVPELVSLEGTAARPRKPRAKVAAQPAPASAQPAPASAQPVILE